MLVSSSPAPQRATTLVTIFAALFLIALCGSTLAQNSFMIGFQPASNDGEVINRGDFNNDGIPDIVVGNNGGASALTVYLSNGDGTFKPGLDSAPGIGVFDMAVGDFNGDGKLDVAIGGYFHNGGNPQGALQIMLGNGDGTFTQGQTIYLPSINSVTVGDFNNDGKLDIALSYDEVYFYQGSGTGLFTYAGSMAVDDPTLFDVWQVRVGDFNGDGRADLAVSTDSAAYVLWGTGPFTFSMTKVAPATFGTIRATPVDVNQDHYTDLIVSYYTCTQFGSPACSTWQVLLGQKGQQTFKQGYTLPPTNYEGIWGQTAADINGDGFNDIVALVHGYDLLVWLGNPDGTYQTTPLQFSLGTESSSAALVAADFNRDGKIDFAIPDPGNLTTAVLLNATPPASCKAGTVSPSITECQPVNFTYSNSPLQVTAFTTDTAHKVTSMQVYINNSLYTVTSGNSLNYSQILADGNYSVVTKAWDSSGANFRTDRHVTIYSGTPGETCPVATSSIHVCSPAQNQTVGTSLHVFANSQSPSPITSVQVYIDGKLQYDDTSHSTYVDTKFSVVPGSHSLVVKAWDANGNVFADSRSFTVQ